MPSRGTVGFRCPRGPSQETKQSGFHPVPCVPGDRPAAAGRAFGQGFPLPRGGADHEGASMKLVLFSSLTCLLILGGCSDPDPVSSNQPAEAAPKRVSSSLTFSAPVAGLAESRSGGTRLRGRTARRRRGRRGRGGADPVAARSHRSAVARRALPAEHRAGSGGLRTGSRPRGRARRSRWTACVLLKAEAPAPDRSPPTRR